MAKHAKIFPGNFFEKVSDFFMSNNKIRSENPLYNELLLAEEEREEISGLPILNVGEVAWRKEDRDWDGAWVLILTREDMWTGPPEKSENLVDGPSMYAYDVLCPDGSVKKYTSAVLRKEKEC